ncbi:MAG: hypothetical protein AB7H96_04260 [Vicinamibacterales bacterium]
MADVRMPAGMIAWMQGLQWGAHHDEWHYTRRFDYWPHLAAHHPDPAARQELAAMVQYAQAQGWKRAALQEGEPGSGLEFLIMHRAMFHLLLHQFPEAQHLLRGWHTPPQDPSDPDDPVGDGSSFDAAKAGGVAAIEAAAVHFQHEDDFGRFLETNIRPTAADPTKRDPDARLGVHNYLHNRWTDPTSDVNLGDPKVNIFNRRFWKLHGWIDHQWWRFRAAKGLADDATYVAALAHYRHMMSGHTHELAASAVSDQPVIARPAGFGRFFAFG